MLNRLLANFYLLTCLFVYTHLFGCLFTCTCVRVTCSFVYSTTCFLVCQHLFSVYWFSCFLIFFPTCLNSLVQFFTWFIVLSLLTYLKCVNLLTCHATAIYENWWTSYFKCPNNRVASDADEARQNNKVKVVCSRTGRAKKL